MHASISGHGLMNPQLAAPAWIVFSSPLFLSLLFNCKNQQMAIALISAAHVHVATPDPLAPDTPLAVRLHRLHHLVYSGRAFPVYKLYLVNYKQCGRVSPTCDLWIFMSWTRINSPACHLAITCLCCALWGQGRCSKCVPTATFPFLCLPLN